jgi:ATP-dependent Clp endopeptidase proteolytic subunit ClpP
MDIRIDGQIVEGLAAQVREQLASAGDKPRIFINSPGGNVDEGLAIYNAIRAHKVPCEVIVDGFALSIASVMACSGKPVKAAPGATFMIHAPSTEPAGGTAQAMRTIATALDKVADSMAAIYAEKTGKDRAEILELMTAETWFTAEEAEAFGLVDEVISGRGDEAPSEAPDTAAMAAYATSHYRNTPTRIQAMTQPQNAASILAAETKRRAEIRAIFTPHAETHRDLLDECLDAPTITVDAASRKLLARLGEGATPTAGLRWSENDRIPDFMAAASDALLQRAGIHVDKPHAGARDLKRMSLQAMAESCVSMRGGTIRDRSPVGVFKAAHTTSDFPLLLANTANKALMAGYEAEPASHTLWVRETEAPDFKTLSRVQRSEAPALLEVAEGAEVTEGSFSERREQYALTTFGRIFSITRQAMVNDDLDAFTTLPAAFGQSARRKEADIVYAILTSNPDMSDSVALFHASHGNLSGSSGAPAVPTLSIARAAMRKQTGPGGVGYLNLVPRYLIVPPELETTCEELIASTARSDQSNPNAGNNAFVRSLQLVVDPRLSSEPTVWYLAADSRQVDTVEVARLAGQRGVAIEEDYDFATGNFRLKAVLDFAAAPIDWRGLYRYAAT